MKSTTHRNTIKSDYYSVPNVTIIHVRREDRGNYICTAKNGIGESVSRIFSLEVSFAPLLSTESPRVGQKVGYVAKLTCKATANPAPSVTWIRNDKALGNTGDFEISTTGHNNDVTVSILKLNEVADHHFGDYICKASNPFGNDETTFELIGEETEKLNSLFLFFLCICFHSSLPCILCTCPTHQPTTTPQSFTFSRTW